MSRTYKRGFTSHRRGDKDCRTLYHRLSRRKTRRLLKEERFDDIITANIDRSIYMADQWGWPSDGTAGVFSGDYVTLRRDFNKAVFAKEDYRRWRCQQNEDFAWDKYCKWRDAAANNVHQEWVVSYDVPDGERLVTTLDWVFDTEAGIQRCVHNTHSELQYKREKKTFDHYPYVGEIPSEAVIIRVWRLNKWKFVQAKFDRDLMEFLFHRGLIPHTFKTEEELTHWLMKNEERIIHSWFKVCYSK